MKRTKQHIGVVVMSAVGDVHQAVGAAMQALIYANEVVIVREPGGGPNIPYNVSENVSNYPFGTKDFRMSAYRWHDVERTDVLVMLEATQLFAEPEYVRDAIEFNPGKVLFGRKYFIWREDDDGLFYRSDSYYAPHVTPVAMPYERQFLRYRDPVDTYPEYAYLSHLSDSAVYPDLDLLDFRYMNPKRRMEDGTPFLRRYHKQVKVSK